jgi:hypothetical protein
MSSVQRFGGSILNNPLVCILAEYDPPARKRVENDVPVIIVTLAVGDIIYCG